MAGDISTVAGRSTTAPKRLVLGVLVGLCAALFPLLLAGAEVTGGIVWLLITGALLGAGFALCFPTMDANHLADLCKGMLLGVTAWALLTLNLYPLLQGSSPMWSASDVGATFPQLIAYLFTGGLTGLLYSIVFRWLAQPLGLSERATNAPAIKTRIVILGGGYAGVAAGEALESEFARDPTVGIWLVSNINYLLHTPMLSEVAASAVHAQHISPPLRSAFQRVQVVQGAVERVDLPERLLSVAGDIKSPAWSLPFDHLIVAAGAVPNFFGNQSIEANCLQFKTLADAERIRNQMISLFERADLELDAEKRRAMLTFVVAGGGFAGVELLGGLNDFGRGIAAFYPNIDPDEIRFVLVHSGETILPELSVELGKYARQKLEERGVEFLLQTRVTGAEPGKVLLGDNFLATQTFIWTAGNRPSPVVEKLGLPLTKRGQLEVDAHLAVVNAPGVWAVGDCAQIPDANSRTGFSPPTAQHALRQGKLVGHNVAASIRQRPFKAWNFKTLGSLSALGHQLAVAEVFGYRFSGLLAWLMWRTIYLSKLPTLEKRVRVGLDWLIDIFFPPDIVQTVDVRKE